MNTSWEYKEIEIKYIKELLENGHEVEILGGDGYQPVTEFVDKGYWTGFKCTHLKTGKSIIVNENHLFETPQGWLKAKNLEICEILMDSGKFELCEVVKTSEIHHIVDIQVDHQNHRYYADGFSSHNTHVGKTAHMCSLAADNLINGENVLYITLEMAEEEIAARIDANLLNVPVREVKTLSKSIFESKISNLKSKTIGKLIIREYPPATASVIHFRALLNELEMKQGFVPSIVYIDYMNLAQSSRMKGDASNSYNYYKAVAEEIRGLAVEKNLAIMTGGQLNRSAMGNIDPSMEGIAESIGTAFTGDFVYAMAVDEAMIERGVVLVKQLKNRYEDKNITSKFFIGFDRNILRFYDIDNSTDGIQNNSPIVNTIGNVESNNRFEGFRF